MLELLGLTKRYGGVLAIAAGGDLGGPVARVGTYLPPSDPLVMPIRVAAGEVGRRRWP